jgi:intraflagellar transport protein 172
LGENKNDKEVISNKFPSAVSCIIWLNSGLIIVGLEDGRVRALQCKNNKSQNLYGTEAMFVALAVNSRGTGIVSGQEDGSVIRFYVVKENAERLIQHSVPSSALAFGWNCCWWM